MISTNYINHEETIVTVV